MTATVIVGEIIARVSRGEGPKPETHARYKARFNPLLRPKLKKIWHPFVHLQNYDKISRFFLSFATEEFFLTILILQKNKLERMN